MKKKVRNQKYSGTPVSVQKWSSKNTISTAAALSEKAENSWFKTINEYGENAFLLLILGESGLDPWPLKVAGGGRACVWGCARLC